MIGMSLPVSTLVLVALALAVTLHLLLQRRKSDAEVLFALFCGSIALAMLQPWVIPQAGWFWWVVAIGGSATCNAYWLVARALFRGDGAVRWPHVMVAIGVAALIVAWRVSTRGEPVLAGSTIAVLGDLLEFAGAAVLALALAEAVHGWSAALPREERRLRLGFVLVFGGCVLAGTVSGALAGAVPEVAAWAPVVTSLCATAIVLYTSWALWVRRQQRRRAGSDVDAAAQVHADASGPTPTSEDRRLAAAIVHLLEVEAIYRQPELKVADVARRLRSAEHKISRAITNGLGERNFNRLINSHRVRHACQLLAEPASPLSVLEISAESGFASLGPFNRAFKAQTGVTPSSYRASHGLKGAEGVNPPPGSPRTPVSALPLAARLPEG